MSRKSIYSPSHVTEVHLWPVPFKEMHLWPIPCHRSPFMARPMSRKSIYSPSHVTEVHLWPVPFTEIHLWPVPYHGKFSWILLLVWPPLASESILLLPWCYPVSISTQHLLSHRYTNEKQEELKCTLWSKHSIMHINLCNQAFIFNHCSNIW